jgi:hypothetical protein
VVGRKSNEAVPYPQISRLRSKCSCAALGGSARLLDSVAELGLMPATSAQNQQTNGAAHETPERSDSVQPDRRLFIETIVRPEYLKCNFPFLQSIADDLLVEQSASGEFDLCVSEVGCVIFRQDFIHRQNPLPYLWILPQFSLSWVVFMEDARTYTK